ncbi:hypothetical protein SynNOUM97013_00854 [Synechococcus sp. NOUM97013]|nr:hypothetical protein SynNOUM97013_00854 [Synechococcus sp. NOUM97013]
MGVSFSVRVVSTVRLARRLGVVACSERFRCFAANPVIEVQKA